MLFAKVKLILNSAQNTHRSPQMKGNSFGIVSNTSETTPAISLRSIAAEYIRGDRLLGRNMLA